MKKMIKTTLPSISPAKGWSAFGRYLLFFILLYLILETPVYASDLPPTICDFEKVIRGLLGFALGAAGLAVFIMFILNGYKWLTAGTNEKAVQEARKGITLAILGLALMFGAWFILLFIQNFTGINVTILRIPGC